MSKAKTAVDKGDPKLAVALFRTSTNDQNIGIDVQKAAAEEWAKRNGVTIIAHFEEHISGKTDFEDRPVLHEAMSAARDAKAGVFLVYKRDRLARDSLVAMLIERYVMSIGATVMCANGEASGDGPADSIMRRIFDAFSEYERILIVMRTRDAMRMLREKDFLFGSVRSMTMTRETLRAAVDLYNEGVPTNIIDRVLVRRYGIRNPKTGRAFSRQTIYLYLRLVRDHGFETVAKSIDERRKLLEKAAAAPASERMSIRTSGKGKILTVDRYAWASCRGGKRGVIPPTPESRADG